MIIFIALNERFKASLQGQTILSFEEKLDNVLGSPLEQTWIEKEFGVKTK